MVTQWVSSERAIENYIDGHWQEDFNIFSLYSPFFRNFKLLSFGDEAEEEEEEVLAATKSFSTKGNSAHDIAMDPTLSSSTGKTLGNDAGALDRSVKGHIKVAIIESVQLDIYIHDTCVGGKCSSLSNNQCRLPVIYLPSASCYRIKKKLRREEETEEKEEDIKSEPAEMEEEKDTTAEPIVSVEKEKKEKMYVFSCCLTAMPKLPQVLLHVLAHRIS